MSFSMPCDPSHDQTMLYGLPGRTHCALSLHIPQLCSNGRDDKFWDVLVRTVRTVRTAVRTADPNFAPSTISSQTPPMSSTDQSKPFLVLTSQDIHFRVLLKLG